MESTQLFGSLVTPHVYLLSSRLSHPRSSRSWVCWPWGLWSQCPWEGPGRVPWGWQARLTSLCLLRLTCILAFPWGAPSLTRTITQGLWPSLLSLFVRVPSPFLTGRLRRVLPMHWSRVDYSELPAAVWANWMSCWLVYSCCWNKALRRSQALVLNFMLASSCLCLRKSLNIHLRKLKKGDREYSIF